MLRAMLIIFLTKIFLGSFALINENREKIALDLIKVLEIRQCIKIIKNDFDLNLNFLKKCSSGNIPILFLNKKALLEYFTGDIVVYWNTAIIIETDSLSTIKELFESLKEAGKEHEVSKFKWLVFLDKVEGFKIEANELKIPYNCEFIVAKEVTSNSYDLKEIYNIKDIKRSLVFGTWDKKLGLNVTRVPFYVRRSNLNNVTMVFAADVQGRNYCSPRALIGCAKREVFYGMEKMLNFHIQFVKLEKGRKGEYADVYDSRSSFHSLFFNYDTIAPTFKAYLNWYIKDPEVEPQQDFYVRPFEEELWFFIFLTIIVCSLVITLSGFVNKRLRRESPFPQLIDNIFATFECFCNQDGGKYRDYASFRIAFITVLLTCLFIIPSYSAVITSFLAVRIPKVPFRNLEEFVENGKYILIRNEAAAFPELYFRDNNNPLIHVVRDRFVKAYPEEEGLNLTCRGLYTMTAPNIYLKDDNAECSFYQIPKAITAYFVQLTLAKNSVFRNVFRHVLPAFYSSGIIHHVQEHLDEIPMKNIDKNQFFPVRIHQLSHIFLMLLVGCAFGIIILLQEVIFKFCVRKQSAKRRITIFREKEIVKGISRGRIEHDYGRLLKKQIRW